MFRFVDRVLASLRTRPRRPERRRSFRPLLECLEGRLVPTQYTVTMLTDNNPADGGQMGANANQGDLRYCMNQANASGDSIITTACNFITHYRAAY